MNIYIFLILACFLVVLSYVYTIISSSLKVPSILLLIMTGIALKYFFPDINVPIHILQLFGTLGLILIVLEGTLELKLRRSKYRMIMRSFLLALLLLVISSATIAFVIVFFTGCSLISAFLYSIPLSIISGAVVIPSVTEVQQDKKEFMIYESTFSDILGILLFNFVAFNAFSELAHIGGFLASILGMIAISLLISVLLLYFIDKTKTQLKFMFMLSVLLILYSAGKIAHMSSLILILIFGLILNNIGEIASQTGLKDRLGGYFNFEYTDSVLKQFEQFLIEISFFIKTFFFVLFGYSIKLESIFQNKVLLIGACILFLVYAIRYVNLRFLEKGVMFPEFFIAPRGLITILLFYSIPPRFAVPNFGDSLLFFIVLSTCIVMMLVLMLYKGKAEMPDYYYAYYG